MSLYVDKTLNIKCNELLKFNLMIDIVFYLNDFFNKHTNDWFCLFQSSNSFCIISQHLKIMLGSKFRPLLESYKGKFYLF